jgi:hypothetical protein
VNTTKTATLRENLKGIDTEEISSTPPSVVAHTLESSDEAASAAMVLSRDQVIHLVKSFKAIGEANIALIEEVQETNEQNSILVRKNELLSKGINRVAYLVTGLSLFSFIIMSVVYLKFGEVQVDVAQSRSGSVQLQEDVKATLGVVRANAEALSYKVKADIAGDPVVTPEKEKAKVAADNAQKKALEVEAKLAPNATARADAKKKLENLEEEIKENKKNGNHNKKNAEK